MAKAIKHFIGHDTFGRNVERAQRFDGVWFARHEEDCGRYGYQMCSWYQTDDQEYKTTCVNAYTDEVMECNPYLTWGFQKMHDVTGDGKLRLRLPN